MVGIIWIASGHHVSIQFGCMCVCRGDVDSQYCLMFAIGDLQVNDESL